MNQPLPPLSAIRVFDAASRHLSFTRAAEELGMTQAAVSYQIRILEENLGFQLFVRLPRRLELTERGVRLAQRVTTSFADLREAFSEVRTTTTSLLTISSNTTFAMRWLSQRIHYFELEHPDLNVRIMPYGPASSPEFQSADVVLSACYPPPQDWHKIALVAANCTPMLSPKLAASFGPITKPEDLLQFPIIDAHDNWWQLWFREAGLPNVDFSHLPSSRMGSQALEASRAISGQGVAILTPYFCKESVERGELIQPFEQVTDVPGEHWSLSYSRLNGRSRKVQLFRDWMLDELRRDGALMEMVRRESAIG